MTTLPSTTRIQLPRPAGTALAMPGQQGAMAPATAGMTAGDVWRVLRANLWLITLSLVLGGAIGFGVNLYLAKNFSRFTATGWVQIAEKRVGRVTETGGVEYMLDMQTLGVEQRSQAQLLRTDTLLNSV